MCGSGAGWGLRWHALAVKKARKEAFNPMRE